MSNARGLTAENILSALPDVLRRSEKLNALAAAIAKTLAADVAMVDRVRIYNAIDTLPEEIIDGLAYDFKVDWYNYDYSLTTKRALLKSSFDVHRRLGTRAAVVTAVQSVFPYSVVQEWNEYGGKPYCFRIVVNTTDHEDQEILDDGFYRAVTLYKSFRSHLDGIMYRSYSAIIITSSTGYIIYANRLCGTYPYQATQGAIDENGIIVATHAEGVTSNIPVTGSVQTGTHPAIATQGATGQGNIIIEAGSQESVSSVPATGAMIAGMHPAEATQGSYESGGISAEAIGAGLAYDTPLCGTAPGDFI